MYGICVGHNLSLLWCSMSFGLTLCHLCSYFQFLFGSSLVKLRKVPCKFRLFVVSVEPFSNDPSPYGPQDNSWGHPGCLRVRTLSVCKLFLVQQCPSSSLALESCVLGFLPGAMVLVVEVAEIRVPILAPVCEVSAFMPISLTRSCVWLGQVGTCGLGLMFFVVRLGRGQCPCAGVAPLRQGFCPFI